jgi:hypothetical protein
MKKTVAGILFLGITLFGADYTAMSLDDLLLQKGSVPEADRAAFQSAMQSKMGALSPEEKANIQNANSGKGQKIQKKDGTGGGNMNKGTKVQGGGRF